MQLPKGSTTGAVVARSGRAALRTYCPDKMPVLEPQPDRRTQKSFVKSEFLDRGAERVAATLLSTRWLRRMPATITRSRTG